MNRHVKLMTSAGVMALVLAGWSAAAQADDQVVVDGGNTTGKVVSGNSSLAGNSNVVGNSLSVGDTGHQTVYTNFRTEGGAGSGGGAGLGGVFFVDSGATLSLTNVSFANNTVKGGEGGGIATSSVAPIATSVVGASADASAASILQPTLSDVTYNGNGQFLVHKIISIGDNSLIQAGAGVAQKLGDGSTGTVNATITAINPAGSNSYGSLNEISLSDGIAIDSSNVVSGTLSGGNTVTLASPVAAAEVMRGQKVYYKDGSNVTHTATVSQVNYNADNEVISYVLDAPISAVGTVDTPAVSAFAVTRFQSASTSTLSNTITPTGPLAGFAVGMTVTGSGIPANTVVTAVDLNTGVVTLSNEIDLHEVTSLKASFSPLIANSGGSAIIQVGSVAGFAIGQTVSGTGIPAGTVITYVDPATKQVTLSNVINATGVSAIGAGKFVLTSDPVLSVNSGAKTIRLASVTGLSVGSLLVGDSGIPENAVITSIDTATNTVHYRIDANAANLNKGGSMNGLSMSGTSGANGGNGQSGSSFNSILVDGEGSAGTNGYNGGSSTNGTGGNGGKGGSGSSGKPFNTTLINAVAQDGVELGLKIAEGSAALANFPPAAALSGAFYVEVAAIGVQLALDTANLVTWNIDLADGKVGHGGTGGQGGKGGNGGEFFGGGAGGAGGSGGAGALSNTDGGAGGTGGVGGTGGFGAGGGSGGSGGAGGANGQSIEGADGLGGQGGFGAGDGSSAGIGGDGGSGFGGAIFVREGGTLFIQGNSIFENNSAIGGSSNNGGEAGQSAGGALFMMRGSSVTLAPGVGNTITFRDSIADDSATSISGSSLAAGNGAGIKIAGGGLVQFQAANTYSGTTDINGGTLRADDGVGINAASHILFSGSGTLGGSGADALDLTNAGVLLTSGAFTRSVGFNPSQLSWTDSTGATKGSGGFAATADGLTVNLGSLNGGVGPMLYWGAGGFVANGQTLMFGSDAAEATGVVTFRNSINMNGGTGRIAVYNNEALTDYAVMSGTLSNGSLIANGDGFGGTLYLTGTSSLSGITVAGGTVSTALNGTTGRLMNLTTGGSVAVTDGKLVLAGAEKLTTVSVGEDGLLMAQGAITSGTINNAGGMVISGGATTGAITNSGVMVLSSNVNATSLDNANILSLQADLTTQGTLNNDGLIYVVGTSPDTEEVATTRTITTAGLTGGADSGIQLGGLAGDIENVLILNQSGNSSYAGAIMGPGSLTKLGAGKLVLTGANSFTGPLTISAGEIDTTGGGTFADTLAVTVAEGARFTVGANDLIASIANAGTLTVNANLGLTTLTNTGSATVNTVLLASGDVSNAADATFTLSTESSAGIGGKLENDGSFTSTGILQVDGATTNKADATMTLGSAGSTLLASLDNAGSFTASSPLEVTGLVNNQASGEITLNGGSTPQFGSLTNAGTINANTALNVTGAYIQNAGSLTTSNNANLFTGSFSGEGGTVALNGTSIFVINQTEDGSYAGLVTGSGTVQKTGDAILTLTGAAGSFAPSAVTVFNGGLTAQSDHVFDAALVANVDTDGTLTFSADQAIASLANAGRTELGADLTTSGRVTNNGTLAVDGEAATRTIHTVGFDGAASGIVDLGANALVIDQSGNSLYAGTVTGTGTLTKQGLGTLNLTGASSFTGGLTVAAGTVDTTGGGTLADTLAVTVDAGASYIVGTNDLIGSIANAGTLTANANLGLTTLTNTGSATVNELFLASGNVSNAADASFTLSTGASAGISGELQNEGSFTSTGTLQVDGATTNKADATMTLGSAGSTLLASLDNAGSFTASSPLEVTGLVNNQASGLITLDSGSTPQFGSLTNAGTIAANTTLEVLGAYVQNAGSLTTNNDANLLTGSFSGAGGAVVLNGTSVFAIDQAQDGSYAGSVSGSGTVQKTGDATLTLTGAAGSFAPSIVTVFDGGLTAQSDHVFASALVANVALDGTLTLNADQAIASLYNEGRTALAADLTTSGLVTNQGTLTVLGTDAARTIHTAGFQGNASAVVDLGTNALVIDQSGDSVYAGTIAGAGSLTKQGAGKLALKGANGFTGPLTIAAGEIDTTGGGTLADTLAVTVASGARYVVGTNDLIGSIANAGTLTANANLGLTTLTNTGSATVNALFAASGDVSNAAGGALTVTANAGATISGKLDNAGSFTNNGTLKVDGATTNRAGATMGLSGAGATLASLTNAGTLTATAPLAITGSVNNQAGGTINLNAGSTPRFGSLVNAGTINAGTALVVTGAYVQNGGTLTARHGLSTGSLSGAGGLIEIGQAGVTINQTQDGTYAGAIAGNGTVVKLGAATLTLAGGVDTFAPVALQIGQGGVTVQNAGILDNALSVDIAPVATLTLLANQTIRDLTGSGTLDLGANILTLATGGTFSGQMKGTGNIRLETGELTIEGAATSTSGTFTVEPNSTLNVSSTSSVTATDLMVTHAQLNLLGTATATTVTISDGATVHLGNGLEMGAGGTTGTLTSNVTYVTGGSQLLGNGTINGRTVIGGASAGTLSPGNSPGVMTFGDLTLDSASSTLMEVDGVAGPGATGGYDQLVVTGDLAIQGTAALVVGNSSGSADYAIPLGRGVRLFSFAPGHVSGHFGSVTSADAGENLMFNLSNGTVYGLGTHTPASFAAAVSANPVGQAAIEGMFVSDAGGVSQYYGGNLLGSLTAALADGGAAAVQSVLTRWSPGSYGGIADAMKVAALNNLPDLGGYDRLSPGRIVATGTVQHQSIDGRNAAGYARNDFNDTAFNVGFAGDLSFAQISLTYGHSTGGFKGETIDTDLDGNQFGLGVSVPLTSGQSLRLSGRLIYGDFDAKGDRAIIGGKASFSSVDGSTMVYGGGLKYVTVSNRLSFDATAELLGLHQVRKAFSEQAPTPGLDQFNVRRMSRTEAIAKIDAKLGYAFGPRLTGYAKVGYIHEFGDEFTDVIADGAIDPITVSVASPGLARNRLLGGLGLQMQVSSSVQLTLDGNAGTQSSYRLGGGVRMQF